jgi:Flp pilus assembly protein TadG
VPLIRFSRGLSRGLTARLRSLRRDTAGAVAVVVAIAAPVLVGSMGLGGEAGYWYLKQRSLQNAADVAAHASAIRLAAGDDSGALQSVAEYIAEQSDIDLANADVALYNPPSNGGFIEDGSAVEVVMTESVPRLFSAMYSNEPVQISARAVATAQGGGTGCVLALNTTEEDAIYITGSATVMLTMCDMVSNSSADGAFDQQGSGNSTFANCIQTVGTAESDGVVLVCESPREHMAAVDDPFAGVPEPAAVGTCQDGNVGQPNQTTSLPSGVGTFDSHPSGMPSMRFCNGLTLSGTVNLDPGLYIVEGGRFTINANSVINGDGVIFYMADGVDLYFNGTATMNVSAPTSGVYQGIVMFGSRSSTDVDHLVNGTAGTSINGAIYLPVSHLTWSGDSQTSFTGCTQVVTDTITFSGNGFFGLHCLFPDGMTIEMAGDVRLVE